MSKVRADGAFQTVHAVVEQSTNLGAEPLSSVLAGRTVVSIAHRLHTAHDADRVLVMEEGRIIELGTHDELLESGGPYGDLWRSWHGERPPEESEE